MTLSPHPPRESVQPAGVLFSWPGVAALSVVLVLTAWHRQTGILLLTSLFTAMAVLSALWSRVSLVGVHTERRLDGTRRFPGEAFTGRLRLFNRKPLPLPWVELEMPLPAGFTDDAAGAGDGTVRRAASLLWYRSIAWPFRLVCSRRGYYPLAPPTVTSGDILGLYPRRRSAGAVDHLIVYPRLYPVDTRLIPSIRPMGELPAERRLFRDPTHTAGVREYDRRDSLRRIHWKATARRGELQVRVPAATTAHTIAFFLPVESFPTDRPQADADFELALSAAASIATALAERGNPVGIFANTRSADTGDPAAVPPSAARGRLPDLLESLAKATPRPGRPFGAFLEDQTRFLPAGTTVVLIVGGHPPDGMDRLTARLAVAGFQRAVLWVGDCDGCALADDTPQRRIRNPEDLVHGGPA